METKICTKCEIDLSIDEFQFRNKIKGKRHSICTECQKIYRQKHYSNNTEYYVKKAKKWNSANKDVIYENIYQYLLLHPCVDCGESDPIVLEFDHLRDKEYDVSAMVSSAKRWEKILEEIGKCQVRCRNCHMRKTAKDFNYWMYKRTTGNAL